MTLVIHDVEQGSASWLQVRLGVPSASNFSRLVTSKGAPSSSIEPYARELAAEVFADKTMDEFDGNAWMNRGKDLEAEALELYAFTRDVEPKRVGFITNHNAGCSPDALVGDDGLVEVKCLRAERHVEAVSYYAKHKKAPSGYIQQTQGQLWITGRTWCDLYFYHPDMPPLVIRQTRDAEMHAALAAAVAQVCTLRGEILADLRRQQQFIPEVKDNTI